MRVKQSERGTGERIADRRLGDPNAGEYLLERALAKRDVSMKGSSPGIMTGLQKHMQSENFMDYPVCVSVYFQRHRIQLSLYACYIYTVEMEYCIWLISFIAGNFS